MFHSGSSYVLQWLQYLLIPFHCPSFQYLLFPDIIGCKEQISTWVKICYNLIYATAFSFSTSFKRIANWRFTGCRCVPHFRSSTWFLQTFVFTCFLYRVYMLGADFHVGGNLLKSYLRNCLFVFNLIQAHCVSMFHRVQISTSIQIIKIVRAHNSYYFFSFIMSISWVNISRWVLICYNGVQASIFTFYFSAYSFRILRLPVCTFIPHFKSSTWPEHSSF